MSVAEHDALARQTSEALAAWRSKPPEPQLEGLTAEQIQAEIDALPPMPNGDLAVHHGVQRALEEMQRAETQFQQQSADRPAVPQALATDVNAPDGELLDLARTLSRRRFRRPTRSLPGRWMRPAESSKLCMPRHVREI